MHKDGSSAQACVLLAQNVEPMREIFALIFGHVLLQLAGELLLEHLHLL